MSFQTAISQGGAFFFFNAVNLHKYKNIEKVCVAKEKLI